jgi:hypothetical protein
MVWLWMLLVGGPTEIPYDGIDQDGDGMDLVDVDGDGYASTLGGGDDCNDRDASVRPGAADTRRDGVDRDCDGAVGEDEPGRVNRIRTQSARVASSRAGAACPERAG